MAKIGGQQAAHVETMDGFEGRYQELGGYTVGFEHYTKDDDPAPLFAGLPDDACQCPHWGIVLEGRLVYRFTDGTRDDISAGEAYFARPGHSPLFFAGTRIAEFSPTAQLEQTMDIVRRNLSAMQEA
jgi:hypothetical protein